MPPPTLAAWPPPSPVKQQRWRSPLETSQWMEMDHGWVLLLAAIPGRQRRELKAEAHGGEAERRPDTGELKKPSAASSPGNA